MNTKKHKHKKPKGNPAETVKNEEKIEEKSEIEVESPAAEAEIPIPVTEIKESAVEITHEKDTEIDTPTKPKRKNKKNKQDKANVPESESETKPKKTEDIKDVEVEIMKEESENKAVSDKDVDTSVTPSARKKKNKKKNQDKPTETKAVEEIKSTTEVEPASIEFDSNLTEVTALDVDTEVKELFAASLDQTKEGKKKKNKKKKRNDSEKSDKAEEVKSCTSAFEMLLAESEDTQNIDVEFDKLTTTKDKPIAEKIVETILEGVKSSIEITEVQPVEEQETKEAAKDENKHKKKNKKDKKGAQKEQDIIPIQINLPEQAKEDIAIKVLETIEPDLVTPEIKQEINIQKEASPKPKAKIAKPVEKKRKDKQSAENLITENIEHAAEEKKEEIVPTTENISKDLKVEIASEQSEIKPVEDIKLITDIIEPIILDAPPEFKSIDNISVPEDGNRKKRKKSPKPPKSEPKIPPQLPVDLTLQQTETIKVETMKPDVIEAVTTEIPSIPRKMTEEVKPTEPEKPKEEHKTVTPQTPEMKIETSIEIPMPEQVEMKPTEEVTKEDKGGKSKKKKKIPKIPTEMEPIADTSTEKRFVLVETENKFEPTTEVISEKAETKVDTSAKVEEPTTKESTTAEESPKSVHSIPLIDIEVRSLRADESEGSSYDVTPDVIFQRSASHQQLDDNNNMNIQEVSGLEEFKLVEPIPKPLIEGSGSTPLGTPEMVSSGIKIEERKVEKGKSDGKGHKSSEKGNKSDEKETVKSKMMDVNKGMEELRISIERSLAEFTAMEKKEQETERKLEEEKTILQEKVSEAKPITPIPERKVKQAVLVAKKEDIPIVTPAKEETKTIIPEETKPTEKCTTEESKTEPPQPPKKDKKGKNKNKKGKQDATATTSESTSQSSTTTTQESSTSTQEKDSNKSKEGEQKSDKDQSENKGKQKSQGTTDNEALDGKHSIDDDGIEKPTQGESSLKSDTTFSDSLEQLDYEPIENFEDALTSSMDDVNKTFEIIAQDAETENRNIQKNLAANKPEINVTQAEDTSTKRDEKINPVSQPKNLLGHHDIPVPSNRIDYKKEKNKTPNERQAKVKIKDSEDIEKISKESQTDSKKVFKKEKSQDSFSQIVKDNNDYVYKYSFRKVFLQSSCHICKKSLTQVRVPCGFCNLVFYCSPKHKDEDYAEHQALCFAVSTIVHLKDQKHIYADAKNVTGQDFRILRMQMIVSCEKVLKRRLVPWEQEALLYPRMCADVGCREWRQGKLKDCEGCGQLSYCTDNPDHLPKTHHKWCKSYSLYSKLVTYQQTKGRLEPKLPTKVMTTQGIPGKINEVLASMYEEKIDMNDIQYAALTQIATAPLTAVYCHQLYSSKKGQGAHNGSFNKSFTVHVVGAELQFEADALNKWEVFFLHAKPEVAQLTVVLVSPALNPGQLPLDLLGKTRPCGSCQNSNRRVTFSFQDKAYEEYRRCEDFIHPDLICAYNPSIQRSSAYNLKDPWPSTISAMLKLKTPFILTSYTIPELRKDIAKIKEFSEIDFKIITEPILNNFASVRPDRNFITDDEMPLLFKNYCVSIICGC